MKNLEKIKRIEKAGYKFVSLMQGGYMAKKGFVSYSSNTISDLYNQIFN